MEISRWWSEAEPPEPNVKCDAPRQGRWNVCREIPPPRPGRVR